MIAEIDLADLVDLRQHHDMAGYYNRQELFQLSVRRDRPKLLGSGHNSFSPFENSEADISFSSASE